MTSSCAPRSSSRCSLPPKSFSNFVSERVATPLTQYGTSHVRKPSRASMFSCSSCQVSADLGSSGVTRTSHWERSRRSNVGVARDGTLARADADSRTGSVWLRARRKRAPTPQLLRHPSCALLQLTRAPFAIRFHAARPSAPTVPGAGVTWRRCEVRVACRVPRVEMQEVLKCTYFWVRCSVDVMWEDKYLRPSC